MCEGITTPCVALSDSPDMFTLQEDSDSDSYAKEFDMNVDNRWLVQVIDVTDSRRVG